MRLQASLPRTAPVNQQLLRCFAGALGAAWPVGWSSVHEHFGELISLSEGDWSEGRGSGEGLERWNADGSSCVGSKCGEERWKEGGSDGCCWWWCDGVGSVARCQRWFSVAVRVMRKMKVIPVAMRMRNREEADRWCTFDIASIENSSCKAVEGRVPTELFFGGCIEVDLKFVLGEGKTLESTNTDIHNSVGAPLIHDGVKLGNNGSPMPMISNEHDENTADLIMEHSVTDVCFTENHAIIACSSEILEFRNAGSEQQRKTKLVKPLVNASTLQQNIRRVFIFTEIVRKRVHRNRRVPLYDLSFYSARFEEQVLDASSLRFMVEDSVTSDRLEVLHHGQSLFRGSDDTSMRFFVVFSHIVWKPIWTLWRFFIPQLMKFIAPFKIG